MDGLEQPAFDAASGEFYVSVPTTKPQPRGAIQTLNIKNMSIARTLPLPACIPAGIVFGPRGNLFARCSQKQITTFGFATSYVINGTTGAVLANISGVAGVDQVAYSNRTNMYYASAYQMLAGGHNNSAPAPILAVIDAAANMQVQTIVTDNSTTYSVVVDNKSGNMILPIKAKGMIIYSSSQSNATSTNSPAPTVTASLAGSISPVLALCAGAALSRWCFNLE